MVRDLRILGRRIAAVELTPQERRAIEAAAAKLVADDAVERNRLRARPLWRDRRAMLGLGFQGVVAIVAVLALLHGINPAWP